MQHASLVVHYKNKYPRGNVFATENSLDVYNENGDHVVALRRDGASGSLTCQSEALGCVDRHDLAPIPKDARIFKVMKDGKIGLDDEAEERKSLSSKMAKDGRIQSMDEIANESKKAPSSDASKKGTASSLDESASKKSK